MEINKVQVGALVIVMVALIFIVCPAYAFTDELNLTGTVTEIDVMHKIVTIKVASSSCHGTRKFMVDNVNAFKELMNVRINFIIDSTVCKGDEVYKVLSVGRTLK